jgi:ATPase
VDKGGAQIVQLRDYRIVITRPPLSDGLEMTIVRPIVKRRLEDYELHPALLERISERAEGILIAGPPGMGKSTFAQALAEHYRSMGMVVKTIESPRDLQLSSDITQYSKAAAKQGELYDVLLLSRPDYTVFDEMRDNEDFKVFIDLRLAGIGMVGVVHATTPMDAIQRIAQRLDIGVIPSVIDTVIFMDKGEVSKVYTLEVVVKVPRGLRRADLARPTVLVKDFTTGDVEYEMYVFGERTFIVPAEVGKAQPEENKATAMASTILSRFIRGYRVQLVGDQLRIEIPSEYMKVYIRKCQRRIHLLKNTYKGLIREIVEEYL